MAAVNKIGFLLGWFFCGFVVVVLFCYIGIFVSLFWVGVLLLFCFCLFCLFV